MQFQYVDYAIQMQVAVILLFTTNFRKSHLAPASAGAFDPTRHLTRVDVHLGAAYMRILETRSKTRQQIVHDNLSTIQVILYN